MKQFMYFENTEGGMDVCTISQIDEMPRLYGWMSETCAHDDAGMLVWMDNAEVGDTYDHRLGVMVRVKDV